MTLPYGPETLDKALLMGDPENSGFHRLLDSLGTGIGNKNMAAAAARFYIKPAAHEVVLVDQIEITILDDAPIDIDGWGGLAALTTGCLFEVRRRQSTSPASVIRDFTNGVPLADHGQLANLGPITFTSTAGGCLVTVHMDLRNGSGPVRIDGDRGESLNFETQDSLVGLVRQNVCAIGRLCKRNV